MCGVWRSRISAGIIKYNNNNNKHSQVTNWQGGKGKLFHNNNLRLWRWYSFKIKTLADLVGEWRKQT